MIATVFLVTALVFGADGASNTTALPEDATNTTESSVEVEICDANSTLCGAENDTAVGTNLIDAWTSRNASKAVTKYKGGEGTMCLCNLKRRFCDLNCCCDNDCAPADRQIFERCDDVQDHPTRDTKFCEYIYHNDTSLEWNVNRNELFCIAKTNLPPKYVYTAEQVKTLKDAEKYKENKYGWSKYLPDIAPSSEKNYAYNYGSPVWMLRNFSEIFALEFPDSFAFGLCQITKQVQFLKDYKTSCVHPTLNEGNIKYFNVSTYVKNVTVISVPDLLRTNISSFKECPRNVCLAINVTLCDEHFNFCKELTPLPELSCQVMSDWTFRSCKNLVSKAKYVIRHNGTEGLQRIAVKLHVHDWSIVQGPLAQEFYVEFVWNNYTLNYSDHTSGNPGYLVGRPILVGDLYVTKNTTVNTTTNVTSVSYTEKLLRSYDDFTKNFMTFPLSVNGACMLTRDVYLPVEFGYNMITKCKVGRKLRVSSGNTTASELCRIVQSLIFEYWSVEMSQVRNTTVHKMVGNFGNAGGDIKGDWTQVIYENNVTQVLGRTFGEFPRNGTLHCGNVTTTMKVDIFHAREEHVQEKIVGTFVDLTGLRSFDLPFVNGTVSIEVPLRSEVVFYDASLEQETRYVDPPSFGFKLPADFFYPFVKVYNSATSKSPHFATLLFALYRILSSFH